MKAQVITVSEQIHDFTLAVSWPEASLFPNRSNGHHWSTRQEAKRMARAFAMFSSVGQFVGDTLIDHKVTIIVYPPDKKRRDLDGTLAALKPTLDGLADGLQINDFRFNPIEIVRCDPVKFGRIVITVHGANKA